MRTARLSILRSRRWRIALGVLAIAVPATADAPKDQYKQFARDEATIEDNFTRLVWDRRGVKKFNRSQGELYCSATVFPGAGRLPTVKELLTIVDEQPHEEYDATFKPPVVLKSIDQLAFPDTPTDEPYWTSTRTPTGQFWTVEFTSGKTAARDATSLLNVRCIR